MKAKKMLVAGVGLLSFAWLPVRSPAFSVKEGHRAAAVASRRRRRSGGGSLAPTTTTTLFRPAPSSRVFHQPRVPPVRVQKYQYGPIPTELAETDKAYRAAENLYAATPGLPVEAVAVVATVFLGAATFWGPDWALAPLGLETDTRPGRATELWLGQLFAGKIVARGDGRGDDDAKANTSATALFVAESEAGFESDAPLTIKVAAMLVHWALGGLSYVILVRAFDDVGFVASLACCFAIAGGVYEIGRPRRKTRQEAVDAESLRLAFDAFAENRLERVEDFQAATHRTEIVKAFRRSVGRYRTAEGSGVPDAAIFKMARRWHRGQVTAAGFFKGLSLKPEADVF